MSAQNPGKKMPVRTDDARGRGSIPAVSLPRRRLEATFACSSPVVTQAEYRFGGVRQRLDPRVVMTATAAG